MKNTSERNAIQLTGKIYWVLDDFNYIGENKEIYKEDNTYHLVSRLKHGIVEENMIKFHTDPHTYQGEEYSYNVNLINEKGNFYEGNFTEVSDNEYKGKVSCELFE